MKKGPIALVCLALLALTAAAWAAPEYQAPPARAMLSNTVPGLHYDPVMGVISPDVAYAIPTTTSIGHWDTAYAWGLTNGYQAAPIITDITSSATPTPAVGTVGATVYYNITALAVGATFGAPTGTPVHGQELYYYVVDNGNAQTLAYNGAYAEGADAAMPLVTTPTKGMWICFKYNKVPGKWQFINNPGGY